MKLLRFLVGYLLILVGVLVVLGAVQASATTVVSANWAGHVAPAPRGAYYDVAICNFTVPTLTRSSNSNQAIATFCGLGASSIVQAGIISTINVGAGQYDYMFYEDSSFNTGPIPEYFVSPGDNIGVEVAITGPSTSYIS